MEQRQDRTEKVKGLFRTVNQSRATERMLVCSPRSPHACFTFSRAVSCTLVSSVFLPPGGCWTRLGMNKDRVTYSG